MAETSCSRRELLGAAAAAGLFGHARTLPGVATPGGAPRALRTRPTRVFKVPDGGKDGRETWALVLIVESAQPLELEPRALTVEMLHGSTPVAVRRYATAGVAGLIIGRNRRAPGAPAHWPLLLWLFCSEQSELGVDRLQVRLETAAAGKSPVTSELSVPIEVYSQKTTLIYPFRGKGIVLQGGVANGGHRNRSGQFALDGLGLDESWSVCAPGEAERNTDYRGWGRPLLAPAPGVVVHAVRDRPDQPVAGNSDPAYYAPEFSGGGDPGNHVVIDHENGEFSMIAHLQHGTLAVRPGSRVSQGQSIGALGNSGDSTGPHVHYQLQAGPDWTGADALPSRFSNVEAFPLIRGTFFEAK
jgi:hypothetical protein